MHTERFNAPNRRTIFGECTVMVLADRQCPRCKNIAPELFTDLMVKSRTHLIADLEATVAELLPWRCPSIA